MKGMSAKAAVVRPINSQDENNNLNGNVEEQWSLRSCMPCMHTGMVDQTDDGLSVEEEWNLLQTEQSDDENEESDEPDFKEQRSWLSETVESYPGCNIFFYPKFHRELYFIEMVWGWTKSHHRTNCTYNYKDLKAELPITLDEKLPIAYVRRAFDHCLRFMNGYHVGLTGAVLEYAVKKYKSHRRLSYSINLFTIEDEYFKKKNRK